MADPAYSLPHWWDAGKRGSILGTYALGPQHARSKIMIQTV